MLKTMGCHGIWVVIGSNNSNNFPEEENSKFRVASANWTLTIRYYTASKIEIVLGIFLRLFIPIKITE